MTATVEPSDLVLTLLRVKIDADDSASDTAEVKFYLWGGKSEAESPLTVYITSETEKSEWETTFDLTPHEIRALHSFLGFALGEIRARDASALKGDAALSEPPA